MNGSWTEDERRMDERNCGEGGVRVGGASAEG